MAKPTVTANSRQYRTTKDDTHWKPVTEAESIGSEQDLNKLSFLYGAVCDGGTDDMGPDRGGLYGGNYPTPFNEDCYEARRKLRRHTIDQGCSTWAFPQKK